MMDPKKIGIGNKEDSMNPSLPLLAKYKRDAFDKFAAKEERWGMTFTAGMGYVEPFVEALKRCGPDLTREKLVAELEKIQNFHGTMGTVSFKPFDPNDPLCRIGQQEVFLVRAEADGTSTILTDWYTTEFIPMGP